MKKPASNTPKKKTPPAKKAPPAKAAKTAKKPATPAPKPTPKPPTKPPAKAAAPAARSKPTTMPPAAGHAAPMFHDDRHPEKGKSQERADPNQPQAAQSLPSGWGFELPPEANHLDELGTDGLTHRQRAFVEAYLGPARMDAAKAATMAGYMGDRRQCQCQGYRLLANAIIQSRVRARVASWQLGRDEVLQIIQMRAGSTFADLLDVASDASGNPVVVISLTKALSTGAAGIIREVRERLSPDGILERTVKINDPKPYIELLAKHHGLDMLPDQAAKGDRAQNMTRDEMLAELASTTPGGELPDALAPRPAIAPTTPRSIDELPGPGDTAVLSSKPAGGQDDDLGGPPDVYGTRDAGNAGQELDVLPLGINDDTIAVKDDDAQEHPEIDDTLDTGGDDFGR